MKKLLLSLLLMFSLGASAETILLTKNNTISVNDIISFETVAKVQQKLFALAANLEEDKVIYLVLDTPGGSIIAGRHLIDTIKALKNPIHTLTLYSASMGYQIVQNLGLRLITPSGVLMSHRAAVRGIRGQVPGEANTSLNFISNLTADMDTIAATRVGLSLEEYRKLIRDEYLTFGSAAVAAGHADKVVFAKCSKSLLGTRKEVLSTFFGRFQVTFSNCPLIQGMLGFKPLSRRVTQEGLDYINLRFNNKPEFFNKYIRGNATINL